MTGPAYPRSEGTGIEGVEKYDYWNTVISQYANSPILTQLISDLTENISQDKNIDDFYRLVMDLETAEGEGLSVWGRIVGVNRVLQVSVGEWFGFAEATPGSVGFGQGSFYFGDPLTENYALSDQAYRLLIYAKAAANITNGSIPAINRILMNLFPGRGNAYVEELFINGQWFGFEEAGNSSPFGQASFYSGSQIQTMAMAYVFQFLLTPVELAIVQNSGVLPKPTGVKAYVVQYAPIVLDGEPVTLYGTPLVLRLGGVVG